MCALGVRERTGSAADGAHHRPEPMGYGVADDLDVLGGPCEDPSPVPSRRRDRHSAGTPSSSLLKRLLKGEAGAAEWQNSRRRLPVPGLGRVDRTAALRPGGDLPRQNQRVKSNNRAECVQVT